MPILTVILGILILLVLIIALRVHPFIALILVALGLGIGLGMSLSEVLAAVQKGVGSTLGYLTLILGFGTMLGGLLAESGAAQKIAGELISRFGTARMQWAMVLTGFIIGIPLFYTVGFVMLIPLIFTLAAATRLPLLYLAIPAIAALSVTHGFLPPHPAPTTVALIYEADMNLTLLYGLLLAIPTVIIAGPFFGRTLKKLKTDIPKGIISTEPLPEEALPSFGLSLFTALLPVLLMAFSAVVKLFLGEGSGAFFTLVTFLGEPVMALLIALLFAMIFLGVRRGRTMKELTNTFAESVKSIAMILLIIGAGGALKQVLVDSGTSAFIVEVLQGTNLSPLLLAWSIAAALRIALGSATVAALTAAGIATPLIQGGGANPELLVLATGAGSLTFSQVNDTGFWLFKEYFELSIWDTFRSWTMMETLVSVLGLAGCLLLDVFI